MKVRLRCARAALGLALVLASGFALARPPAVAATAGDVLEDRARAEGTLTLYSAMSTQDTTSLVQRFMARYPIQVRVLRVESSQLPAKIAIAAKAGQPDADVEIAPGFQTDALERNGLLDPYPVPEDRDFTAGTFDPNGYWSAAYLNTDTIAYNPDRLKAMGVKPPTSWADLARPEWRGKVALFNGSYEWFATMRKALGAAYADRLMAALAANAPVMVATHQLALNMTAAGEYAAAMNVYGYDVDRLAKLGQPVALVNAAPTVGEINAVAIVKSAPHPDAARFFVRWLLSRDTQRFVVGSLGRISARKDVKSNETIWNKTMRIVITNPADSGDYADDVRRFNQTFGIGP
jgi:iron(III) transport system substrate-binding protein